MWLLQLNSLPALITALAFLAFIVGGIYLSKWLGEERGVFRGKLILPIAGLFILGALYMLYLDLTAAATLSEYVRPYPNYQQLVVYPIEFDETIGLWTMETRDPAVKVADFYADDSNSPGWTTRRRDGENSYLLERDGLQINIHAFEINGQTTVYYRLDRVDE
jgi:hypothetical protein